MDTFSPLVFSEDDYLGLEVFSMEDDTEQYAAFSTPQVDGQTIVKMIDY